MAVAYEWKTFSENAGITTLSDDLNAQLDAGWDIFAVTLNSTANAYVILLRRRV